MECFYFSEQKLDGNLTFKVLRVLKCFKIALSYLTQQIRQQQQQQQQ